MTIVCYLRQSKDATGEGAAIDRQHTACQQLAEGRRLRITEVYRDNDLSAASGKRRPDFDRLLADIEAGKITVVIAWALDRLTRNARDTLRIIEAGEHHGITLALVSGGDIDLSSPAGRFTAGILAGVARHEIEQKSARQILACEQAARAGKPRGGRRPFGYEPDGITIREPEAEALRLAYTAVLDGVSLGEVTRELNAAGHHTPLPKRTGEPSPWRPSALRSTLLNPRYAGLRARVPAADLARGANPRKARLAGIVGKAVWQGIVGEDTWRAVVAILTAPDRRTPPRLGQYLLSGVARCGVCGGPVNVGGVSARGGRERYSVYRCQRTNGHLSRQSRPADEYVSALTVERLSRPDARELLADHDRADADALATQAAALRIRLDRLGAEWAEDDQADPAVLQSASRALRKRLTDIEAQQADAGRTRLLGDLVGAADVGEAWAALSTDRRRLVIDLLMAVSLDPPGRGVRGFRPETVRIEWR